MPSWLSAKVCALCSNYRSAKEKKAHANPFLRDFALAIESASDLYEPNS